MKPIIVHNALELKKIDIKIEGVIIAKVGLRKKLEIVKEAQAAKIKILNLKDPAKFLEETNKKIEARKKEKEEKEKSKKEKPKKTAEKAEKKEEEISEEEKQKKDKEEKDKLLIKKT